MKQLAVATRQARQLTRKRITRMPRRITGLHRLSIVSKNPFSVDIGGRVFDDARTLDVFHETPMFIDGLENAAALDLFDDGEFVRMIRLHPAGDDSELSFRITAKEEMQERHELEAKKKLACVETPLEYEGLLKHTCRGLRSTASEELEGFADAVATSQAMDKIAGALAVAMHVGAAMAVVMAAKMIAVAPAVATTAVVCDPSRTYINGRLYKNLKEVRVRLTSGRVCGYTDP